MPNIIRLDDKEYVLRGPLRWMNISEWGTVLRTTAELRRSDRTMAGDWVIEALEGGMGLYRHRPEVAPQRYYWGDLWTLHPAKVMLPPLIQDTAATGYTEPSNGVEDGNLFFLRWLKGNLYTGGNNFLRRWNTGTSVWDDVKGAGFPADFQARDACTFFDGTNEYIVIAYDTSTDTSAIIKSTTGDSGSWTSVSVASGTARPGLILFEDKVLVHTSSNITAYSTDLVTFTTFRSLAPTPAGRNIALWLDSQGRITPYLMTTDGPFVLDFTARKASQALGLYERMTPWNFNGVIFRSANGYLWISGMKQLIRVSPGGAATDVGPWRDDGLPNDMTAGLGLMWNLIPWGGAILVSIRAGAQRSSILAFNGMGWHPVVVGAANNPIFRMALEETTGAADVTKKLYFTYGAQVKFVDLPVNTFDLSSVSGMKYAASAHLYTAYWDGGLSELTAGIFKALSRGYNFTATETLAIAYSIDYADGTETSLGTITTNKGTLSFASGLGIEAESIRYKLTLARGADNTKSPVMRFLTTKVLKQAETKFGWEGAVDLGATAKLGRDAETVRGELETLYGAFKNVTLKYAGKSKQVQMLAVTGALEVGGEEGVENYDIGGAIQVRMAEVV